MIGRLELDNYKKKTKKTKTKTRPKQMRDMLFEFSSVQSINQSINIFNCGHRLELT